MAVLLKELTVDREAVLVGELAAEMNGRARIALAEGVNLPECGKVVREILSQLVEIVFFSHGRLRIAPSTSAKRFLMSG